MTPDSLRVSALQTVLVKVINHQARHRTWLDGQANNQSNAYPMAADRLPLGLRLVVLVLAVGLTVGCSLDHCLNRQPPTYETL